MEARTDDLGAMSNLNFAGRTIPLPKSKPLRMGLGITLCIGGLAGFLPILGFWMLPLGLAVLSVDVPWIHRRYERLQDWWERRQARKRQGSRPNP